MAKAKTAKPPVKVKPKKKEVITEVTCPDACHYWHKVYDFANGVGCTKGFQPGTKNSQHAFNLAKGFKYKITHTRLANGKCKLKIEQGPYIGCPPSSIKAAALGFELACEQGTCSIENCPDPEEIPNSTCDGCVLPPRPAPKHKK